MSGLSVGLATFSSCNKAGSIPHFNRYLSTYPNDYTALTWRGRAYSIIGNLAQAKADFQKACRVSFDPRRSLAQAQIEHIDGHAEQKVAILRNITRQYPSCSEAWQELGSHHYHSNGEPDLALEHLREATQLANANSETGEPWFPWCQQTMGDIYFDAKQDIPNARRHYAKAVQSCNTLTIGHLGLSKCDILSSNDARAESSFWTARNLNPVLVKWETFDDFRRHVKTNHIFSSMVSGLVSSFVRMMSEATPANDNDLQVGASRRGTRDDELQRDWEYQDYEAAAANDSGLQVFASRRRTRGMNSVKHSSTSVRSGGWGAGGSGSGKGGSGDGSSSDSDDKRELTPQEIIQQKLDKIKKNAPKRLKYNGLYFYQSDKDKKTWYSPIKPDARHGGAFLKKYEDKGRTLELKGSADENGNEIPAKHESGKYQIIKKSDMQGFGN